MGLCRSNIKDVLLRHAARLRLIENEIQAAYNFLLLARLEFADERLNAATQLIVEAENVADIVEGILNEIPDHFEPDRTRLSLQLEILQLAIQVTRANKQSEEL